MDGAFLTSFMRLKTRRPFLFYPYFPLPFRSFFSPTIVNKISFVPKSEQKNEAHFFGESVP